MRRTFLLIALLCVCCAIASPVLASPVPGHGLRSPFPTFTVPDANPKGEIFDCKITPAPPATLEFKSIYKSTDPTESVPDPVSEALYRSQVAPLNAYLDELSRMSNIYTRSKGRNLSSAKCVLNWMSDWAEQESLLMEPSRYGRFVRAWTLASLSSSYIQISVDKRLDAGQKVAVKKWLSQLNKTVMRDYNKPADGTIPKNNNLYWAAWAVGITSTILQNPEHFQWAIQKAKTGLFQIEDDGTLPLEVRRSARAQTYHLFAAIPLVMMAELAANNGINLYNYNNGALHHLVNLNVTEYYKPDYLTHRAGAKQYIDRKLFSSLMGWLEPYNARFGFKEEFARKNAEKMLRQNRPIFDRRIGGDVTLLFGSN